MHGSFVVALSMSTLAGLSTVFGSLIALFSKRTNTKLLSYALGFSAGVMLLVSFAELLPEAKISMCARFGERLGGAAATASMLLGLAVAMVTDLLVPSVQTGHVSESTGTASLARMGFVTAIALTLHNFPEGIATFMAGYSNFRLGLPVTLSVAMHNIPEGIAVSVPIYYGTGNRARAFGISALSGLSEPLGALAAYFVLAPFLSSTTLGAVFGAVAGIMIYLSFDELIPASKDYGHQKLSTLGILSGIIAMWLALSVFNF